MFKKRLKGLLAMLLAGSIAATALPLTASATISDNHVSVCDGDDTKVVDKSESKTLNIPVLNGLGKQEMKGGNPYTISVTGDCYDDLETYDKWFYVGYTKQNGDVVLSDYNMNRKVTAWTIIEGFAKDDPNFDVDTLFFLRSLGVSVCKDSTLKGSFTSKDLYQSLATNDPENLPDAYKYIVAADANSIWRTDTSQKYVLGKDLLKGIETYLDDNPKTQYIYLSETTEIMVTGTEPVPDKRTESYEKSPLYVEDTKAAPVQTVPATISDHLAVLEKAGALEAGNIFDTSGWQLWGCSFKSGGVGEKPLILDFKKSALESTSGINSIGIDQLNTVINGSPLIYFPQVKIAPSLEITAPVAGETPSFDYAIKDTVGGYSVHSVEWACGKNDEFKAGKEYTFSVVLQPDTGLQFAETTKVKINGNDATTTLNPNDGTLKVSYTFEATKATPYIKTAPTATAITYGEALSASTLKDAVVWYSESDQKAVEGTFTWKKAATKPTVADSEKTKYDVVFTPTDVVNYNTVETKITLTVNKAASAPGLPNNTMEVDYGKKVSDVTLPEDWAWQDEDKDEALTVETAVKATAVYTGADKGNYETESVEISITRLISFIITGRILTDTGASIEGNMTGPANYKLGQDVTLTVPVIAGYNFVGWYVYSADSPHYTGENLCTSRTYKFTAEADRNLVAVYKPIGSANLTIDGGKDFTINGDNRTSVVTDFYPLGSQIKVVCNDSDFEYWKNSAGMVVSRDKSYTFTVTGKETISAVFNKKAENKATVVFESYYGQVIARDQYAAGATLAETPGLPFRYGYTALGWDYNGDGTYNAETDTFAKALERGFDSEDKLVKILPVYQLKEVTYQITVENGTGAGTYKQNEVVTVVANAAADGYKFSHWADNAGNILSYNEKYQFYAAKNITVTAVYVKDTVKVEAKGTTEIVDKFADKANEKLTFVSMSTVPEGCTIDKAGIIATNDQNVAKSGDGFNAGTAAYVRGNSWTGNAYRYTWTKSKVGSGETWYVRAYLVYTDAEGNVNTVYSDKVSQTMPK